ncbi:uncharacterized protein [Parasteatoda tepidariorum]|uniref:uncharacterized protein n=1 Tax=Parasteatoda tepidariorum TaxID=114398 RepID=UPI001C71CA7F|nr:uncharacterized protein LOC122273042 [Parasteatoda tepidariorum]
MEGNSESTNLAFPKLGAFNYDSWKCDMRVALMDRGSWEFVGGAESPSPPVDTAPESVKQNFEIRKARAYSTIYQGVERQFLKLIQSTTDGRKAWDILKENFEPKSRARIAGLVDEFYELKFQPNEEVIGIFCQRVRDKSAQIKEAGFEIPELLVCFQIIRKLPEEYDNLVQILYRLKDSEFTINNIESQLISESGRIQLKARDSGFDSVTNAYLAKTDIKSSRERNLSKHEDIPHSGSGLGRRSTQETGYRRNLQSKGYRPKGMGPCFNCNKQGHYSRDCRASKTANKMQDRQSVRQNPATGLFYTDIEINEEVAEVDSTELDLEE